MNKSAQTPSAGELARYRDALDTGLLNIEAEKRFDRFIRFLAQAVDTACAIMFISDLTRHHFVAREGISNVSTPREGSVLSHLLFSEPSQVTSVSKLSADKYWHATNTSDGTNAMQSLLSMPLLGPSGYVIGGIVLMDTKPHEFTQSDEELLTSIAGLIQNELQLYTEELLTAKEPRAITNTNITTEQANIRHKDIINAELERARLNDGRVLVIEAELIPVTSAELEPDVLEFLQQERIAAIHSVVECTVSPVDQCLGRFSIVISQDDLDVSVALQRMKTAATGISSYEMKPIASKVNFGVAIFPNDGRNAEILTEVAESALTRAKKPWNQDVQFGSSDSQKNYRRLHLMEAQLGAAVPGVDLQTIFQPIIDANNGQLLGVEASCQWRTKEFGVVLPSDFLSQTSNSNLLRKVVDYVTDSAIRQGAVWQRMTGRSLLISLPISLDMLNVASMANRVAQQMKAESLAADSLLLVVHLNDLKDLCPSTAESIHNFQGLGIRVAVNYNNTEYSALQQLRSLTVGAVKLQRHFLESITIGQPAHSITKVVMDIVNNLGMELMIEDVQNEQELAAVRELGCRAVQGDFISPAVSCDEISSFLTEGAPLLGNTA